MSEDDLTMQEYMEQRSCDNPTYIHNMAKALTNAVQERDIDAIIFFAQELQRYKTLCGETGELEEFEKSLRKYAKQMNLLGEPHIKRALETIPQKTCQNCQRIIKSEPPYKKTTKTYIDDVLFSVKEETVNSLEPPPIVNISLFGNYEIPNENLKKPAPAPEEPKPLSPTPQELKIREMLEKNVFNKERTIAQTQFPEICSPNCEHIRQCPYGNNRNFGKPCVKREELYKNE